MHDILYRLGSISSSKHLQFKQADFDNVRV